MRLIVTSMMRSGLWLLSVQQHVTTVKSSFFVTLDHSRPGYPFSRSSSELICLLKAAFTRYAVKAERCAVLGSHHTQWESHETERRDHKVTVAMYRRDHSTLSTRSKSCPVYTQYYSWRLFPYCYLLLTQFISPVINPVS